MGDDRRPAVTLRRAHPRQRHRLPLRFHRSSRLAIAQFDAWTRRSRPRPSRYRLATVKAPASSIGAFRYTHALNACSLSWVERG